MGIDAEKWNALDGVKCATLNMSLRVSDSAISPMGEGGRSSVTREYCFACLAIAFFYSQIAQQESRRAVTYLVKPLPQVVLLQKLP